MLEINETYCANLGDLFTVTAIRNADKPALIWDDKIVTYQDLASKSAVLMTLLQAHGCRQGSVIAIVAEKQTLTYSLIIACLRIGAPYVMLDPTAPETRQKKILQKCYPTLIFTGANCVDNLTNISNQLEAELINTDALELGKNTAIQTTPANLSPFSNYQPSYIMFTSGSTGFPKGAVMTHLNVMLFISWAKEEFGFGPGEVLTNVNPLYFDNSVFDIYASLFTGAALAPFDEKTTRSPGDLLSGLDKRGCTSWFSVPSLLMYMDSMKGIRKETMTKIRRFIFGGEGYPKSRLKKLYDTYGNRAELINVYGPTECTCICSAYRLKPDDFDDLNGFPPLGSLTRNFDFLILDENNQKTAPEEVGELCLLGPCVGKGYYNDPERTTASFTANPLNTLYPNPMYRTGDMVWNDPQSGNIHISGRKDNQIKHMGYRIELEEIENALATISGIQQAVAVHGRKRGMSCIIAVVSTVGTMNESQLKDQLKTILPTYMIPTAIHFQKCLPFTSNGKIDRKQIIANLFPLKESPAIVELKCKTKNHQDQFQK